LAEVAYLGSSFYAFGYYLFSCFFILSANLAGGFFTFLGCSPYSGNYEKSNFFPPMGKSSGFTASVFLVITYVCRLAAGYACSAFPF
jgi:hypothetical protein